MAVEKRYVEALLLFLILIAVCTNVWAFYVKTDLSSHILYLGENRTYSLGIVNNMNEEISVNITLDRGLQNFLEIEPRHLTINPSSSENVDVQIIVGEDSKIGRFTGFIKITTEEEEKKIPMSIEIKEKIRTLLELNVKAINEEVIIDSYPTINVVIFIVAGSSKPLDVKLKYVVRDLDTEIPVYSESENLSVVLLKSFDKTLYIDNLSFGRYYTQVVVEYQGNVIEDSANFEVVNPFWTPARINAAITLIVGLVLFNVFLYVRKRYFAKKKEKARYIFPVDSKSLPKKTADSFWVGRIAETNTKTFMDSNELVTHTIVAGATGAGKSVTASIIVEEALIKRIPVIIFDPTAQWTGMVRPCKDKAILDRYKEFGLNPERDPRQFKGLIMEMNNPNQEIDMRKYVNPGEVTVFDLSKLYQIEHDLAVRKIVDSIFQQNWEEHTGLKLLIVFDEVHRLLEKYGGGGGYKALEKACREFRKWGIGLIMVSQITSDFKEAVAGNILTEIQMNTKAIKDISRIGKKYGKEYSQRVTRERIGTGLVQNPKYNDGRPYFVEFRPPFHAPHKLPDEDLKLYVKYSHQLESLEQRIEAMEAEGKDTSDLKLELRLSGNKLKEGRFRMVKIYIDSLEERLK